MNIYYANCHTAKEEVIDWIFEKLFRTDIIDCFAKAAETDLALFDLSRLSVEYDYIQAYGELLLLARNQN